MNEGQNVMGIVSTICGALAIFGHGCCCLPLISYVAPFVVITLEIIALVTGLLARNQAAQLGTSDPMATLGLALAVVAILLSLAYVAFSGTVVVAYILLLVGSGIS